MEHSTHRLGHILPAVFALMLVSSGPLFAQARFGGRSSGSSSYSPNVQTRQYLNKTLLGDAVIEMDEETRSLVVVADDETSAEIAKVIEQLDQPKPQVLIKVLFLEVTHRGSLDLGVQGTHTSAGSGVNESKVDTLWGLAEELEGGFWSLKADDWDVTLRAMAEKGHLEVLSRPSILARNNQEAVMMVGDEIPLVTNSRITDNGQTINTIQYTEIGIILRVTPFIRSDDQVEMIVAPEISGLSEETVPISETVRSPVISKRSAETVVVTPHGKTVVIGGLMETQKTDTIRKVPLLGDIPVVGALFRRHIKEDEKKELIIFLTPYIVSEPGNLVDVSKREMGQTRMVPDAVDKDAAARFLEGIDLESPEQPE